MLGLFEMIGEIASLMHVNMDATNRRKRYELLLDKKSKKALNAAETIIHGMDSFLADQISLKQFKVIFRRHRKIFFAND